MRLRKCTLILIILILGLTTTAFADEVNKDLSVSKKISTINDVKEISKSVDDIINKDESEIYLSKIKVDNSNNITIQGKVITTDADKRFLLVGKLYKDPLLKNNIVIANLNDEMGNFDAINFSIESGKIGTIKFNEELRNSYIKKGEYLLSLYLKDKSTGALNIFEYSDSKISKELKYLDISKLEIATKTNQLWYKDFVEPKIEEETIEKVDGSEGELLFLDKSMLMNTRASVLTTSYADNYTYFYDLFGGLVGETIKIDCRLTYPTTLTSQGIVTAKQVISEKRTFSSDYSYMNYNDCESKVLSTKIQGYTSPGDYFSKGSVAYNGTLLGGVSINVGLCFTDPIANIVTFTPTFDRNKSVTSGTHISFYESGIPEQKCREAQLSIDDKDIILDKVGQYFEADFYVNHYSIVGNKNFNFKYKHDVYNGRLPSDSGSGWRTKTISRSYYSQ